MIEAYPLCWPAGKPRATSRGHSNFKTNFGSARDKCRNEIYLLGGRDVIISTNIPLKGNGDPYADSRKNVGDTGVAVYFNYKKKAMAFCCDRWWRVEDNMHAISLTIGAMRGISRWGTGDMQEAAFTGFIALPAPGQTSRGWRQVFGVDEDCSFSMAETAYKILRSRNHPDKCPGDLEAAARFDEVQKAYEQAKTELGIR